MILTIKNADFSAANIGTLSSYVVSKTIGAGAAFDIPSTVDKNSSVNWIITLDEGYTFGTYSVTMGSEVITTNVVDNVMTISIAEVTSNVRIVVATVNVTIDDETGGFDEDDGLGGVRITSGTLAGAYLHENRKFAKVDNIDVPDVEEIEDTAYFIIRDIPVYGDKTYRINKARATWFLDANKQPIGTTYTNMTSSTDIVDFTFTTPSGCAYLRIAFKYVDITPENVILEKKYQWIENSTTLLKDSGATYMTNTAIESGKTAPSTYSNYFTYHMIPVTGGNKYKLENCRLSIWYDSSKNFISQINFNVNSTSATTKDWSHIAPDNAAYLSCCIKVGDIDKDAVKMVEYVKESW